MLWEELFIKSKNENNRACGEDNSILIVTLLMAGLFTSFSRRVRTRGSPEARV